MASVAQTERRFGTFAGVFRPTILTILGALLYLREGWVIGHAGLGGFILILVGMYIATGTTALSMASITTNIRLGQGGVFSIISQSLGLEAGGSIGLPFYLAQSLGGAMYLFAFAEAWAMIFPSHPQALVVVVVFIVVLLLALVSSSLALKTQSIVVMGIIAALASAVWGLQEAQELQSPAFWGPRDSPSLTSLFALFFPAATGVLVGASMSGSLANPRRSVPLGTLAAVGVSFAVYLLMGIWFSLVATPEELRSSYTVMVDKSSIGTLVLLGLLSSTLSAAISSMVAAPRVLHALALFRVIPGSQFLSETTRSGEPRRALLGTAAIIALGLMSGSLDAIAPMLTVFFLITYASINLVLLLEQSLGLPSFRPTFKVPLIVPLIGSVVCILAIAATSPVVGLGSLGVVGVLYAWLVRRRLDTPFETARSGLFVNIAAWAAKKIADLPASTERSWKPDVLMPVLSATEVRGAYRLLKALAGSKGSIKLVGLETRADTDLSQLAEAASDFKLDGIYCSSTSLPSPSFGEGATFSISVLQGDFFPPNVVFVSVLDKDEAELQKTLDCARSHQTGLTLFAPHPRAGLGRERDVNLWVRAPGPDWKLKLKMGSLDLTLLLALQVTEGWRGRVRLLCVVRTEDEVENTRAFLDELAIEARIFGLCGLEVLVGDFADQLQAAPQADLNIFGLGDSVDLENIANTTMLTDGSCLFVRASGKESALA